MRYRGIDVSHHNGAVDWKRVKASGVEFAMIRSGFGWDNDRQIDRQLKANVAGCSENGIPFGFYHYSYAMSPEDAQRESRWFLRVIQEFKPEYPVAFDFEEKDQLSLPLNTQISIIRAFMDGVQNDGYYALLYMSGSAISRLYAYAPDVMGAYDAWVARWGAENAGYAGSCGMWQYDVAGVGGVPGVAGKCDVNYAYKDYPHIIKAGGLNGWKKPDLSSGTAVTVPETHTPELQRRYDALLRDLRALADKYGSAV